jgi:hypothetical protein
MSKRILIGELVLYILYFVLAVVNIGSTVDSFMKGNYLLGSFSAVAALTMLVLLVKNLWGRN